MINTVLGEISSDDLGITLMHEHILWDWDGAAEDYKNHYDREEVVKTMLPRLKELRKLGCRTLVEASTYGSGRDVEVLKECSAKSGLNIITNCGMWDGGDLKGRLVPREIKNKEIDEIAAMWQSEFFEGIEGTRIKPGFIKLALGDEGIITELQEKMLRAAVRVSLKTGLLIECHMGSSISAKRAVEIIEEEKLPMNRFVWVHIDWSGDYDTILKLGEKGIWLEIDALSFSPEPYEKQVKILKRLIEDNLLDQVLISQDAGCYYAGEVKDSKFNSYNNIFTKFIPICESQGISQEILEKIMTKNTARALNIE